MKANGIIVYAIAFIVFLVIDLLWLGLIANNLYQKYLGYLMAEKVNWTAALIFYAMFIFGIVYFVIYPSLANNDFNGLLIRAALFGLLTYATYDLTNLATIRDWPLTITIIDLIWGTSLSTMVSVVTYWIIQFFFR